MEACLRLQGLYRIGHLLFLVASDCVYRLRDTRLMPVHWHPRFFLFERFTNELTAPTHWTGHYRYQKLVEEKGAGYFSNSKRLLLHHAFFLTQPTPTLHKVTAIELLDFLTGPDKKGEERIVLHDGRPGEPVELGRFFGLQFNGVMNGKYGKNGYVLVANGSVTTFWDRGAFHGYKGLPLCKKCLQNFFISFLIHLFLRGKRVPGLPFAV